MSTIEEAREQAREALANHAVNIMETDYWCDVVLAPALRALLDATEPSTVAVKTEFRVLDVHGEVWAWAATLEDARHYADQEPEGEPARIEQQWVSPWIPVATEPPAQAEPAEDEREALVMTLYANGMAGNLHEPIRRQAVEKWADAILADGYSKVPRPITDEMVAAADFAIMPYWGERYPSGSFTTEIARAALEAAEEARR